MYFCETVTFKIEKTSIIALSNHCEEVFIKVQDGNKIVLSGWNHVLNMRKLGKYNLPQINSCVTNFHSNLCLPCLAVTIIWATFLHFAYMLMQCNTSILNKVSLNDV